ncbi:hypothetical protein DKT68_08100 [Micromonospora acroterricola]|uniref:Uncharacterized protein n=1 Tax=Micromonospora acroterricola TaxID=2202421 RepID=A0A317D951_9ACTN|nr:hypothetical protein [Micromonospora acroterricola]PWR10822.1 hypothetical protein DKT68_08100 [Micromonospora acroterricola]
MDDGSLDLDPDGLLQVARGIGDLVDLLLSVEPLVGSGEESLVSWADELPRIGAELRQIEELLREVTRSVTATDDELATRLAQHGDA